MKYGVRSELQGFARTLAAELRQKVPRLFEDELPPAVVTVYKAAAPPSTTLARYCSEQIVRAIIDTGSDLQRIFPEVCELLT